MKRITIILFVVVLIALGLTSCERESRFSVNIPGGFTIINKTGITINGVWIKDTGSTNWGANRIGG